MSRFPLVWTTAQVVARTLPLRLIHIRFISAPRDGQVGAPSYSYDTLHPVIELTYYASVNDKRHGRWGERCTVNMDLTFFLMEEHHAAIQDHVDQEVTAAGVIMQEVSSTHSLEKADLERSKATTRSAGAVTTCPSPTQLCRVSQERWRVSRCRNTT